MDAIKASGFSMRYTGTATGNGSRAAPRSHSREILCETTIDATERSTMRVRPASEITESMSTCTPGLSAPVRGSSIRKDGSAKPRHSVSPRTKGNTRTENRSVGCRRSESRRLGLSTRKLAVAVSSIPAQVPSKSTARTTATHKI